MLRNAATTAAVANCLLTALLVLPLRPPSVLASGGGGDEGESSGFSVEQNHPHHHHHSHNHHHHHPHRAGYSNQHHLHEHRGSLGSKNKAHHKSDHLATDEQPTKRWPKSILARQVEVNEIVGGQTELLSLQQHHATTTTTSNLEPTDWPQLNSQTQVPLQQQQEVKQQTLPAILVSSSDNSYVSASPTRDDDEQEENRDYYYKLKEDRNVAYQPESAGERPIEIVPSKTHIWSYYDSKEATIIKTRESIAMGATFINHTIVTNLNACLVECWITDLCDTTIYQETPVDFRNHLPTGSSGGSIKGGSIGRSNSISNSGSISSENEFSREHHTLIDLSREEQERANQRGFIINDQANKQTNLPAQHSDYEYDTHTKLNLIPSAANHESLSAGFFICYLFKCTQPDGYKCQFSPHANYVSSSKHANFVRLGQPEATTRLVLEMQSSDDTFTSEQPFTVEQQQQQPIKKQVSTIGAQPHFSRIIGTHTNHYYGRRWHDTHIASIKVDNQEVSYQPERS